MKILLDECLPTKARRALLGHEAYTVADMGWLGVKNGRLLAAAAEAGFDLLLTVDGGMAYQQNQATLPLAIVIMKVQNNALPLLRETIKSNVLPLLEQPLANQVYKV